MGDASKIDHVSLALARSQKQSIGSQALLTQTFDQSSSNSSQLEEKKTSQIVRDQVSLALARSQIHSTEYHALMSGPLDLSTGSRNQNSSETTITPEKSSDSNSVLISSAGLEEPNENVDSTVEDSTTLEATIQDSAALMASPLDLSKQSSNYKGFFNF